MKASLLAAFAALSVLVGTIVALGIPPQTSATLHYAYVQAPFQASEENYGGVAVAPVNDGRYGIMPDRED